MKCLNSRGLRPQRLNVCACVYLEKGTRFSLHPVRLGGTRLCGSNKGLVEI